MRAQWVVGFLLVSQVLNPDNNTIVYIGTLKIYHHSLFFKIIAINSMNFSPPSNAVLSMTISYFRCLI